VRSVQHRSPDRCALLEGHRAVLSQPLCAFCASVAGTDYRMIVRATPAWSDRAISFEIASQIDVKYRLGSLPSVARPASFGGDCGVGSVWSFGQRRRTEMRLRVALRPACLTLLFKPVSWAADTELSHSAELIITKARSQNGNSRGVARRFVLRCRRTKAVRPGIYGFRVVGTPVGGSLPFTPTIDRRLGAHAPSL
jgi:hypothetical protein